MNKRIAALSLFSITSFCAIVALPATADVITTYTDRTTFNNSVGVPLTVEDFTDTFHFPISTGVLNAETNLPDIGILPGDIQAGVTYSTPIGTGNFFNIDAGGGYTGGFLDGFNPSDREVTIDFWNSSSSDARPISAFGFDLGSLGSSDFDVLISFSSGPDQLFNNVYPNSLSFFGFQSDATDITQVVIGNNGGFFGFDFDNFTFDSPRAIPEPSSLLLGALCSLGLLVRRKRGC